MEPQTTGLTTPETYRVGVDREELAARLTTRFDGSPAELRVVLRQAIDLRDAGRYGKTHESGLTVDSLTDGLAEAPGGSLVDRWNWWIGALDLAHGDYERFLVRSWVDEE